MPLVPLKPVLDAARRHGYAQGAFNVNAVCQAKAAIEVHEMFRSPVILQGADLANAFMGGRADFANGTVEDKIRARRTSVTPSSSMASIRPYLWCSISTTGATWRA